MTYEQAMQHVAQGHWMTRQAWVDDDLCKHINKCQSGGYMAESYDIGERYGYRATEQDKAANDWRYSPYL